MNPFQILTRKLIRIAFDSAVSFINFLFANEKHSAQLESLRTLKQGTLGKEIADCLDKHSLSLVPGFESHDLKHVLLGYGMTPQDEIRLQAFMIGNGNYSVPSFAIFSFGALLLPELWPTFQSDFRQGRNTQPISDWSIESYADSELMELREELQLEMPCEIGRFGLRNVLKGFAVSVVLAGVFGMFYCLPYLYSSRIEDLVGAGFPFVGGAVLVVGGIFTLSNLIKEPQITT